jgi:hypothetical protein
MCGGGEARALSARASVMGYMMPGHQVSVVVGGLVAGEIKRK